MDVLSRSRNTGFYRVLVALCAALIATAFCIARGHVQAVLGDASTYSSPVEHRCGQLMLLCIGWALIDLNFYLRPTSLGTR